VLECETNCALFRRVGVVDVCYFCVGEAKRLCSVHKRDCIQFEKEICFEIQQMLALINLGISFQRKSVKVQNQLVSTAQKPLPIEVLNILLAQRSTCKHPEK